MFYTPENIPGCKAAYRQNTISTWPRPKETSWRLCSPSCLLYRHPSYDHHVSSRHDLPAFYRRPSFRGRHPSCPQTWRTGSA